VKKIVVFCFFTLIASSVFASEVDINIIYEASRMKVTETICGEMPSETGGYIETEKGCFQTRYELDVPMYGFSFEPKTLPSDEAVKFAYYISFFDSASPKKDLVKTEIVADGEVLREVENLVHERTFQGLLILEEGQTVRLSSEKEPSYMIIYVMAIILVAAGLTFIMRRKK